MPFINDMASAYSLSDLVVCRSGALTISELTACGKPSILIPFAAAAGDHQLKNAKTLSEKGASIIIEEKHMQAATVLCASGIAFWMRLIRATTQGGVQLGFDANEAMNMSMHTALGAASLLIEGKTHPEQEIDKVTTPRGCTIIGLNEMEHQGLSSSLIKGLVASFEKINEISIQ